MLVEVEVIFQLFLECNIWSLLNYTSRSLWLLVLLSSTSIPIYTPTASVLISIVLILILLRLLVPFFGLILLIRVLLLFRSLSFFFWGYFFLRNRSWDYCWVLLGNCLRFDSCSFCRPFNTLKVFDVVNLEDYNRVLIFLRGDFTNTASPSLSSKTPDIL